MLADRQNASFVLASLGRGGPQLPVVAGAMQGADASSALAMLLALQAAGMFRQGVKAAQIACELRVSTKSVYQRRRRWRAGGEAALASRGPGGAACRLGGRQLARNLSTHLSAAMRVFTGAHGDWLTGIRLPACAPDLNAVEGAWANMKNTLGNLAAAGIAQPTAIIKNRLKSIQHRPALIDGFLAQTGLTLESEPT